MQKSNENIKIDKSNFPKSRMSSKFKVRAVVLISLIIPSSGYVFLRKSSRGFMMLLWMFLFGYITFQLTSSDISIIGRLSGAFGVWTISVVEIHKMANKMWISE